MLESVLLLLLREKEASDFMVEAERGVCKSRFSIWPSTTGIRTGCRLTLSEVVGDDNDWLLCEVV